MKRNEDPKMDKHIPMPPFVRSGVPGLVEKVSLRTPVWSRGEEGMKEDGLERVADRVGAVEQTTKGSKMNGEEMED